MRVARKAARIVAPVAMPVIDHDCGVAADFSPLPVTQIALMPALYLGQFAVADSLKRGFVDICQLNHFLIAHNDRCGAIDNGPHGQLGLNGYADLAEPGSSRAGLEYGSNLRRDTDTAAREREKHRLLILVARERPGQLASGIGAILEWHLLTLH